MYTPHKSLICSLIICCSTSSPSGLIAVRSRRSTINLRPRRSSLAFRQAFVSSAVQGAVSLPSTLNRRWRVSSTTVIFNMSHVSLTHGSVQRTHQAFATVTTWFFNVDHATSFGALVNVKTVLTLRSAESNVRNNREDRCQVFSSGPGESSGSHASAPQLRPPLPLVPSLR